MRNWTLILGALLLSFSAGAQRDKLTPLFFPASLNNVQVLAQRFEYALLDSESLRIGDILINAAKMRFSLSEGEAGLRLGFTWPAALLTEGKLTLLNNNGKAIWSSDFHSKELKITTPPVVEGEEDLRNEIAEFLSEPVPASLVEDLKYLPFLNFCVSRETENNKLYLCSQDLYFSVQKGQRVIRNRSDKKKQAYVEINGKTVTEQGLIYLNDSREDLMMRAQAETGASIEIITRKSDVDFRDALLSEDGKRLLITAKGAEPVRKDGVKILANDEWQIALSRTRPYFFIKAAGGIPMRQEFFVKGDLPSEKFRPFIHPSTPEQTYSREVTVKGVHPAQVTIKSTGENSQITPLGKNRFDWSWRELEPGKNRRTMLVESGGKTFIAAADIERGRNRRLETGVSARTPDSNLEARLAWRHELESFLGRFVWSYGLEYGKILGGSDQVAKPGTMAFGIWRKFTPGFMDQVPSGFAGLWFGQTQIESFSSTVTGFDVGWQGPPPGFLGRWLMPWIEWSEYRARLWSGMSGEVKPAFSWKLEARFDHRYESGLSWTFDFGLGQSKTTPAAQNEKLNLSLGTGLIYLF